jgi:hypothetical protein
MNIPKISTTRGTIQLAVDGWVRAAVAVVMRVSYLLYAPERVIVTGAGVSPFTNVKNVLS